MGNYSGTTRCGHCYGTGHNKAGCPELKKRVERIRADDPNNYFVLEADRKAAARKSRATGARVCAYCKAHRRTIEGYRWRSDEQRWADDATLIEVEIRDEWGDLVKGGSEIDTLYSTGQARGIGHSVRACKYREADLQSRMAEITARRVGHLHRMISYGIGVGASIELAEGVSSLRDFPQPGTFVITSVHWAKLGTEKRCHDLYGMQCMTATHVAHLFNQQNAPYGKVLSVTLPEDTIVNDVPDNKPYLSCYTDRVGRLHSTAPEEKIRASIPFGWAEASDSGTQTMIMEDLMSGVKTRSKKSK